MTAHLSIVVLSFVLLAVATLSFGAQPQSKWIETSSRQAEPSGQSSAAQPFTNFRQFNARRRRNRRLRRRCRRTANRQFRTLNGYCNNIRRPRLGAAKTPFVNLALPFRRIRESRGLNARRISNIVCEEAVPTKNDRGMSELVTFFGQFMDHTITETVSNDSRPLKIRVPRNDPVFVPRQFIPLFRSVRKGRGQRRAPENELSHFIDASSVYGVSEEDTKVLRAFRNGRLRLPRNLLPRNRTTRAFLAGDARVNENPNLIAMHLIFAREHNRVAREVRNAFPNANDNRIFEITRHIVAAEIQAVLYYEWIPALTGSELEKYNGYDPDVDPRISTDFSTVAFRVGHTLLNKTVNSVGPNGKIIKMRTLRSSFFNPGAFVQDGMDNLFRGMMHGHAAEVDNGITGEVRNFLISEPNSDMQLDLASLNIQRGRDHLVPECNGVRKSVGLPPFTAFSQITKNRNLVRRLRVAYKGRIDDIDPWICGISEDHEKGSSLGPMFHRIVRGQFKRLRDGDRFYFENPGYFRPAQIRRIRTVGWLVGPNHRRGRIFREIIARNTKIRKRDIKRNPFFV